MVFFLFFLSALLTMYAAVYRSN